MTLTFSTSYLEDTAAVFRQYQRMAEAALAQLSDEEFFRAPEAESNSAALIVKHLAGNLRSRWTDFLTSDGEKPWRHRDSEFELEGGGGEARRALLEAWAEGWAVLLETIASLSEADLARPVLIRNERHAVMQAIQRALAHAAYHTGQIVFLAKQWRGADWKTLSVPKGKSEEYNRRVVAGEASQR